LAYSGGSETRELSWLKRDREMGRKETEIPGGKRGGIPPVPFDLFSATK